MRQYLENLKKIITEGTFQGNRTDYAATTFPGTTMSFDLQEGFPIVTTKKMAMKAIKGELIGFLRGYDNAADFRALGCNIWNDNANKPYKDGSPTPWLKSPYRKGTDDLGRIYGVQWRSRHDVKIEQGAHENSQMHQYLIDSGYASLGSLENMPNAFVFERYFDQVSDILERIEKNPTDRRMILDAWTPHEFDEMSLPPCHVKYQFLVNVERGELNLCMYQRSCDYFLGVPFNISSAAMLLEIIAAISDLKPRFFTHFLADSHIYENAMDAVKEQIKREPLSLSKIKVNVPTKKEWEVQGNRIGDIFDHISPDDIVISDYEHHDPIRGIEMAV